MLKRSIEYQLLPERKQLGQKHGQYNENELYQHKAKEIQDKKSSGKSNQ